MKPSRIPLFLASAAVVSGCVVMPTAPMIAALPGSQKNFDQFRIDDDNCRGVAGPALAERDRPPRTTPQPTQRSGRRSALPRARSSDPLRVRQAPAPRSARARVCCSAAPPAATTPAIRRTTCSANTTQSTCNACTREATGYLRNSLMAGRRLISSRRAIHPTTRRSGIRRTHRADRAPHRPIRRRAHRRHPARLRRPARLHRLATLRRPARLRRRADSDRRHCRESQRRNVRAVGTHPLPLPARQRWPRSVAGDRCRAAGCGLRPRNP